MARAVAEIEKEIRALKPDDQEQLLRALLEELDGPADPDVERAWLAEAQRRSQELDSGVVEAIPAEEVFGKARAAAAVRSNFTPRH
jgi:putative addiction module component (TIGR02574 family)